MTKRPYRAANTTAYIILMIVFGYLFISFMTAVITGTTGINIFVQIIVTATLIVVSTIFFIIRRDTRLYSIILMANSAVAYVVIALFNRTEYTFLYGFILIYIAMVYCNLRITVLGNIVVILANILRILTHNDGSPDFLSNSIIVMFTLILTAAASISVSKRLLQFNRENLESISQAADKQADTGRKMVGVSEQIAVHFDDAMTKIKDLKSCIDNNHSAMNEIADSTVHTAESIQVQAEMCTQIQDLSDSTDDELHRMLDASERTEATISEGQRFVDIHSEMGTLSDSIQKMKQNIQSVIDAVSSISDSISQLSATSEEVAASSSEGVRTAESAVDSMKQCTDILTNIYTLSEYLKKFTV